jgi:dTDP-4-amino-4,6-dideoxygalactose transaminase
LPLIIALEVLEITGEVITTPYSFVATTHALWWNGIKPVFVDVEEKTGNLDPSKIEAAITSKTTAIMPVHVYGTPCNTEAIQQIADKHGLKVIYDAAHAFAVEKEGKSILTAGDISTLSFHATKTYNTAEGGAIVCKDENTKKQVDYLKNFGFAGETNVVMPGINGKMDEIRSALGLLNLKYVDCTIEKRGKIASMYRELLKDIPGIRFMDIIPNVKSNYSYFPVFVDKDKYGMDRDELYETLKTQNIYGRRYFYPLISDFSPYKNLESASPDNLPVAVRLADTVLCLPIYDGLNEDDVKYITTEIKDAKKDK